MSGFATFSQEFRAGYEATWRQIYERHQDTIKIKRVRVALPNLERIILATLKISNGSSFHSMSLRDLGREAGMSMGSLYTYIEGKEQLSAMILGHVLFLVDTVLDPGAGPALPARERLRWLLRRHVYLTEVMQPWFFFAFMEAKALDPEGRRMAIGNELRTERLIADLLAAGQAAGAYGPADPVMAASLIKPLLQDWYLKRWKHGRRGIDPDGYADQVIALVEAHLAPVPARRAEQSTVP